MCTREEMALAALERDLAHFSLEDQKVILRLMLEAKAGRITKAQFSEALRKYVRPIVPFGEDN